MNPAILRKMVRETLNMVPGYGHTEAMIVRAVNFRLPAPADLSDVRAAIEWNHGKAYLKAKLNEDTDQREYRITPAGIAKEEIS